MKIYADEDIEDDIVEIFKSEGVNIKSAREIGLRGKPDSFQAAYALKEKRFCSRATAKTSGTIERYR
jgi:predicted nuclease of predicted toxin-antitoxin system